jgi:photosystem II stability/assembly factor-like uncharacterized protein
MNLEPQIKSKPEHPAEKSRPAGTAPFLNKLSQLLFYTSLFVFIVALAFPHNPAGNWYQQFLPNINGASIRDITFTDSLNGYSVTSIGGSNSYILKTTNSGDNWVIKFMHTQPFVRVQFINANTGFTNAFQTIFKTTNAGENWSPISLPGIFGDDMFVLSEDTIWLAMSESLTGGVFFTSTGGSSWQQQINLGSSNPNHIYMFNARIGFISEANSYLRRTTNGGLNWDTVPNDNGFRDMFFIDSLKGWKCGTETDSVRATTNGGLSWFKQFLPPTGGFFNISAVTNFAFINKDTIYGVGPRAGTTLGFRGMIYKTVNGGQNWGYQLPDTNTINISRYSYVDFYNKLNGWAYAGTTGIHTTNGGDTTFYLPVHQISSEVPKEYTLFQNYPNPFNPKTNFGFRIAGFGLVELKIFDITGKEIAVILSDELSAGEYKADWNASGFSSGVYFYSLIIDGKMIDTRKMVLIK